MSTVRMLSLSVLVALFSLLGLVSLVLTVWAASVGSPLGFLSLVAGVAFYVTAIVIDGAI